MRSLYQRLLRLYPAVYRQEFGEEMQCVFLQAQAERSIAPLMKRAGFRYDHRGAVRQRR